MTTIILVQPQCFAQAVTCCALENKVSLVLIPILCMILPRLFVLWWLYLFALLFEYCPNLPTVTVHTYAHRCPYFEYLLHSTTLRNRLSTELFKCLLTCSTYPVATLLLCSICSIINAHILHWPPEGLNNAFEKDNAMSFYDVTRWRWCNRSLASIPSEAD